jgi:pre-mRNA-splicing factor SPF27
MTTASSSQIFDSLPYYDNDLEQFPILKEKVERELAKEGQPPSTLHPSLGPEFELFTVSIKFGMI